MMSSTAATMTTRVQLVADGSSDAAYGGSGFDEISAGGTLLSWEFDATTGVANLEQCNVHRVRWSRTPCRNHCGTMFSTAAAMSSNTLATPAMTCSMRAPAIAASMVAAAVMFWLSMMQTSIGSAEFFDGGSGFDTVELQAQTDNAYFDLTGLTTAGVNRVEFAPVDPVFDMTLEIADDAFAAPPVAGSLGFLGIAGNDTNGATEKLVVNIDSTHDIDLSFLTFSAWGGQGELVEINGSALADHHQRQRC